MKIKNYLPLVELLAGLAEECCELAQAALKLRRSYDGTNPTPKDREECYDDFCEEVADVMLYLDQIQYNHSVVNAIKMAKIERWERRLSERKRILSESRPGGEKAQDPESQAGSL